MSTKAAAVRKKACSKLHLICTSILFFPTLASADIIFESGTLGPTGVSWTDLENQSVPGTNISTFAYNGTTFQLTQPVLTTEIGGHFVAATEGTFFGAIVELSGPNDFPNSGDLSTPDALGHALLSFPTSSAEVFADLELALHPGWYALVFGSGLFGADANGGAVRNGMDIGNPSYIAFQPSSAFGWVNTTTFTHHRFVVLGCVVPEPSFGITAFVFTVCMRYHPFRSRSSEYRLTSSVARSPS